MLNYYVLPASKWDSSGAPFGFLRVAENAMPISLTTEAAAAYGLLNPAVTSGEGEQGGVGVEGEIAHHLPAGGIIGAHEDERGEVEDVGSFHASTTVVDAGVVPSTASTTVGEVGGENRTSVVGEVGGENSTPGLTGAVSASSVGGGGAVFGASSVGGGGACSSQLLLGGGSAFHPGVLGGGPAFQPGVLGGGPAFHPGVLGGGPLQPMVLGTLPSMTNGPPTNDIGGGIAPGSVFCCMPGLGVAGGYFFPAGNDVVATTDPNGRNHFL